MQQIKVKITKIVQETSDTFSFYLEREDKMPIAYQAGQFLTLLFEVNGHEVRRSYSIGSTPGYEKEIFITIKRKENGEISRKMHDVYKQGDTLYCLLPNGKFVRDIHWGADLFYFFFAAGSGIVPIFGIIKSILHENAQAKIFLLNQATSEKNIIYQQALTSLSNKYQRFEYQLFLSQPADDKNAVRRLNNLKVEQLVNERLLHEVDRKNARFYICGPTTFMRMVKFTLKLDGFTDEQIKQEQFIIQEIKPVIPLLNDKSTKKATIIAVEGIFKLDITYPQSILEAARKAKIALPYSCNAGQCSTCAVTCTSGEVVMSHNDILTEKDLSNHLILTCTGHPKTDIVLDYTIKTSE